MSSIVKKLNKISADLNKRTAGKYDLPPLKKGDTAEDRYYLNFNYIQRMVKDLQAVLKKDEREFRKNPKNWNYVGSLNSVHDDLKSILEFLG